MNLNDHFSLCSNEDKALHQHITDCDWKEVDFSLSLHFLKIRKSPVVELVGQMDTSISLPCTIFNLVLPNSMKDRLVAMCVIPEPPGDVTSLRTSTYQVSAESITQQRQNSQEIPALCER